MGTKGGGVPRGGGTGPGRPRQAGRVPRNRLEKIPIPPVPDFLRSVARTPGSEPEAHHDRIEEIISRNAISDEEADLLLGVGPPAPGDRTRPAPRRSPASGTRDGLAVRPPEDGLTEAETDDLLSSAPERDAPPPDTPAASALHQTPHATARTGESGADVLNDLVEEIEKDLERVLERQAPPVQTRRYGRTIGCWVSPLADDSHPHPPAVIRRRDEEGAP